MHRRHIQACNQRHHVRDIERQRVLHRIAQPVGLTASGHVGANHAVMPAQRGSDDIEVARTAGQAMHADQHARVGGIAPFAIGQAVQAPGGDALHRFHCCCSHDSIQFYQ